MYSPEQAPSKSAPGNGNSYITFEGEKMLTIGLIRSRVHPLLTLQQTSLPLRQVQMEPYRSWLPITKPVQRLVFLVMVKYAGLRGFPPLFVANVVLFANTLSAASMLHKPVDGPRRVWKLKTWRSNCLSMMQFLTLYLFLDNIPIQLNS